MSLGCCNDPDSHMVALLQPFHVPDQPCYLHLLPVGDNSSSHAWSSYVTLVDRPGELGGVGVTEETRAAWVRVPLCKTHPVYVTGPVLRQSEEDFVCSFQ